MKLVGAIKWVDEVVGEAPYKTMIQTLDKNRCDFCLHGDDVSFTPDGVHSFQEVIDKGRYREFKRTVGVSTTDLIKRILTTVNAEPVTNSR